MARSTTKETKIRNIIEKTGDNYKDQLKSLEQLLSSYYRYIFTAKDKDKELKACDVLYFPSFEDIKKINMALYKHPKHGDISFREALKLSNRSHCILMNSDDFCINSAIKSMKRIMFNTYEHFLSSHKKSIAITMSYNKRGRILQKRLNFLVYILNCKYKNDSEIKKYFDKKPVDKPHEQIHELSCIIQNLYNGIFPGFYTHEEIENLLRLATGDEKIQHRDIRKVWENFPPPVKRILPNPYFHIPDLLAKYQEAPPPPLFPGKTS